MQVNIDMIHDLHSHTTFSDGALTPQELISLAIEKDVDVLAITDHDTLDAYQEIPASHEKIRLVPGIELSTQWENTGIHIIGLNVDPASDAIQTAAKFQTDARMARARVIGDVLAKHGIENAFEGARELSIGAYIGRPHFARFLANTGRVNSIQAAFKKYLGAGKPGDVKRHWAELSRVIQWIRDANGIAVLAHPLKYKLTRTRLKRLLDSFQQAGGQGMEVVSGRQLPQQTNDMAALCEQRNLLASCGSDFHQSRPHWAEPGEFPALPGNVTPVWERF